MFYAHIGITRIKKMNKYKKRIISTHGGIVAAEENESEKDEFTITSTDITYPFFTVADAALKCLQMILIRMTIVKTDTHTTENKYS